MKNQTIIHIANYAAPYKGNFISSLELLEEKLNENGYNRMIYIFPESCRYTSWIDDFSHIPGGYRNIVFVPIPKKRLKLFNDKKIVLALKKL